MEVGPARQLDGRDLAQRHRSAARHRHENVMRDRLGIAAQIARIADIDAVAFAALDRRGDGLAAERRRNRVLHVADHQAVARQRVAVGDDVEVVAADDAFGISAGRARHGLSRRFRSVAPAFHLVRSVPNTLMPTGVRMPVASMSMRALIGMVQALETPGNCKRLVHFGDQPSTVRPGAPLAPSASD